jgi:hypothetical protein
MTATYVDVSAPFRVIGPDMPGEPADEREKFARVTREYPDENAEALQRAFLQSKLRMARTDPDVDLEYREHMASALAERFERDFGVTEEPVPVHLGYGFLYYQTFKRYFATGTSLGWDIICPDTPGGNVNDFLYVTGMNRAVRGLEAFVAYFAQNASSFCVWDWARPAPQLQVDVPLAFIGDYRRTVDSHGLPRHRCHEHDCGVVSRNVEQHGAPLEPCPKPPRPHLPVRLPSDAGPADSDEHLRELGAHRGDLAALLLGHQAAGVPRRLHLHAGLRRQLGSLGVAYAQPELRPQRQRRLPRRIPRPQLQLRGQELIPQEH